MRGLCLFLVLAAAIHASHGADNKLYVTFGLDDPNHEHSFYELPRTLNSQSEADGWSIVEERWDTDKVAVACRNNNYQVCLLVDKKKSVAGLQLSAALADFEKLNSPIKAQQEKRTLLGTEVVSGIIYFVDEGVLNAGGRDIADDTPTAPNGFLIKTAKGLSAITKDAKDIDTTEFSKQECFLSMGRHYFENLTSKTSCDDIGSYFGLYDESTNKVNGFGYTSYANATVQADGRVWFEYVPGPVIKFIAPNSPSCTTDYVNKYGSHSLHVYVTEEPWNIHCSLPRDVFLKTLLFVKKLFGR